MSSEDDNIIVNLGLVINSKNQVLMIKRREKETGRSGAVLEWSFPGGKQDASESGPEGLVRKILGKTGYQVEVLKKISSRSHPQFSVQADYYLCRLSSEEKGEMTSEAEKVAAVRWVAPSEVVKLIAVDLDLEVFQELSKLV